MPYGKRIYLKRKLPPQELIDGFSKIPSSNIDDVMDKNAAMSSRIRLMSSPHQIMCGPAYTVKVQGGNNLALHAALNYAGKGDIIVISDEGEASRALIGEVMMSYLKYQDKIGGIVIDGDLRDIDVLKDWDLPIYATGTTPDGPYIEGPGEVNVPISAGNRLVKPGDIIVGDEDGVIVIPLEQAADILPKAQAYQEQDIAKAVANKHEGTDREWVARELEKYGFEVIDDIYRG